MYDKRCNFLLGTYIQTCALNVLDNHHVYTVEKKTEEDQTGRYHEGLGVLFPQTLQLFFVPSEDLLNILQFIFQSLSILGSEQFRL